MTIFIVYTVMRAQNPVSLNFIHYNKVLQAYQNIHKIDFSSAKLTTAWFQTYAIASMILTEPYSLTPFVKYIPIVL